MGKQYRKIILRIMKLSITPCLLWLLGMHLSLAKDVRAQEVLSQRISITVNEMEIDKVLEKIEGQTRVRFIYSAEVIRADRKVTLDSQNQRLGAVLETLLGPLGIEYKVSRKTILLLKAAERKTSLKTEPLENVAPREINREITGKVLDEKGQPIPGASVIVKGTTLGTSTNAEGEYILSLPDDKDAIIFSFVGYVPQEVLVGTMTNLVVTLKVDEKALEEVVVVGFGQQKKVSVTGAVASVTSEVLQQSSSASLANSLSGRLPGLTSIQSGGGQPGRDDATMYLRGAATTNGRSPLILIDGVPRDNIRTLDANEVASVSILKDASATAVFGVRGANGVILITTKRGSAGKNELTINAEQSFSSFTREPERLHSLEYMALRNEASRNDGISPLPFDDAIMAKYANPLAGLDPNDPDYARKAMVRRYMYPDHDYYREYISRYAPQTRVNMNVTGGTDKVSYFVNGGFLHQGGNLNTEPKSVLGYDPSSKMDRYSFRANLDYKVTNSLKSFLNIGSYIEQVNMPSAWLYGNSDTGWMMSDLIYQAQTILPITPGPVTIDGFGVAPGQIVDPGYMDRSAFEIMNRMGYRNEVRSNLNASFGMDWDLSNTVTKGLSIKGMISYDARATTAMQGKKSERLYLAEVNPAKDELTYAVKRSDESLLALTKAADSRYNINMQGSINYARTFGRHDVTGMILGQRDTWESTAGEIPYNVLGVAARATYAYDERYLAEVNMGYNGSEQFAPGHRYGFFPAVSAGWVISNERFLKNNRLLTNLKLRASYGKVGNDKMGSSRFLYQSDITLGGSGPLGSLGLGQTINQGLLGNPNITWEIAQKQNYGLDAQLLGDLSLSVDVFKERRSNILISRGTVPEFQGVPLGNIPKVNMGLVDNQGYELELSYNKAFNRDFRVMVSGNYGYNHNTVKFLDESVRDETYVYRYRATGFPLNQSWGYKIDYSNGNGFFNSKEELDTYLKSTTYGFGEPRVGDFKYVDLNGDGVIDDKDQAPIGYSNIPRVTYGLSLTFEYKGFDLTTFFQGVGKYSSNYQQQGVYEYIIRGTYFDYHKSAWTPERYAAGEEITYPALSTHSTTNHTANDFFIMNRSFTRLKNLVLGYTVPAGALKGVGISKLRVYVSAQNYFTWDRLKMGHLDPENDSSLGYPVTKMANFGLNLTF
ncbi:TonB-linked SusC/RagA family outer membrane protein [Larkinella arboricola]|uniref:TonB-linked SusC/RagA family outer membrane protein n=2 Tax=Larkinella arboricola TaxID=643671 RepID=A0A327WHP3_LARAB|nr:TonB-linked SusC/RagA family outer membrane protein [Larkinella arboricola]